jgi:hypothetical protein
MSTRAGVAAKMHKSASMRSRGGYGDHEMSRICDMQVAGAGLVSVWVNSRDHCDPHVHCADKGGTWESRIRFSFLNNLATFWDCLTPATDPGRGVFTEISRNLAQHLRRCRAEWWRFHAGTIGCCLANSMQDDVVGQPRRWLRRCMT